MHLCTCSSSLFPLPAPLFFPSPSLSSLSTVLYSPPRNSAWQRPGHNLLSKPARAFKNMKAFLNDTHLPHPSPLTLSHQTSISTVSATSSYSAGISCHPFTRSQVTGPLGQAPFSGVTELGAWGVHPPYTKSTWCVPPAMYRTKG